VEVIMYGILRQLFEKAGQCIVHLTSSATLTSYKLSQWERVVRITTDDSNAITVTLPPAGLVTLGIFDLKLVADGGVNATIKDTEGNTVVTFADANDAATLFSNGFEWIILTSTGL